MKKAEAVAQFKADILPALIKLERPGYPDWPRRRMAWNNWTDILVRNGAISHYQDNSWSQPECVNPRKKRS